MEARSRVGLVDDLAERHVVDALLALIGRQRVRRLVEGLARDDVVAACKVLAVAAQVDAREYDLGTGGSDVDADAHQRHVILQPDGILFQRAVIIELEMVVVVIGVLVVLVYDVFAIEMVGEAVSCLLFLILGIGHLNLLLNGGPACARPAAGQPSGMPNDPFGIAGSARVDGGSDRRFASPGLANPQVLSKGSRRAQRFETIGFHPDRRARARLFLSHIPYKPEPIRVKFSRKAEMSATAINVLLRSVLPTLTVVAGAPDCMTGCKASSLTGVGRRVVSPSGRTRNEHRDNKRSQGNDRRSL